VAGGAPEAPDAPAGVERPWSARHFIVLAAKPEENI